MTTVDKLPALAKKGLTQAEAARKLGVSRQRVSQLVAKLRLRFTTYAKPVKTASLAALAKRGLTQTETAKQLGVSQQRVSKLASEHGITFSPLSMRPRTPATQLGKVMQKARLAHGYSYTKLAERSGLDRHHVTAIEVGRVRRPTPKTLRSLAKCLRPHTSFAALVQASQAKSATAARKKKRQAPSRRRKSKR
jgi:transcriptional regulator with XRE-family HTH domain